MHLFLRPYTYVIHKRDVYILFAWLSKPLHTAFIGTNAPVLRANSFQETERRRRRRWRRRDEKKREQKKTQTLIKDNNKTRVVIYVINTYKINTSGLNRLKRTEFELRKKGHKRNVKIYDDKKERNRRENNHITFPFSSCTNRRIHLYCRQNNKRK